ncbi:MAG: DUF937 domain-containing protein [Caulobacteraceae bacterium]|nr:MAG: DUF937 domain-containing protein [Caulobacteraceae bacterium]
MGLLDQALGSVLGGRGGGPFGGRGGRSPLVNILLMALAAKALQHYMAQHKAQADSGVDPDPAQPGGGIGGMLGGLLGGLSGGAGGLGGLLGGLAGAGGLGSLLSQFDKHGLSDTAQSWVAHGPNTPIAPQELERALGPDTVQQLAQETGLPPQALIADLSSALPDAIDHLTPDGRLPDEQELQQLAARYEGDLRASAK